MRRKEKYKINYFQVLFAAAVVVVVKRTKSNCLQRVDLKKRNTFYADFENYFLIYIIGHFKLIQCVSGI